MGEPGTLFGREREREVLRALLGAVSEGSKRALGLIGEPGIGKTALLNEARSLADDAGFLTGFVRAPAVVGMPHAPARPLLEAIRTACSRHRIHVPNALHTALATMFGEGTADADTLLPFVAEALDKIGERAPVGFFVDDYHRASPGGREFLCAIARAVESPLVLMMTAPTEADLPVASADLLIDICEVRGLTVDAAAELARAEVGGPLLPSLLETLTTVTLTNPLYLKEALRDWIEVGALTEVGGFIGVAPDGTLRTSSSLGALIAGRIAAADTEVVEVARTLAIVGRDVQFGQLVEMCAATSADLVSRIEAAVGAGILTEDSGPPITYRIGHPMYERALLAGMSPTAAGLMHQRIYLALRERRDRGEPIPADQIARHALEALEQPADVGELIRAAALEAQAARSLRDAAAWWARAGACAQDEARRLEALRGQALATVEFEARAAAELFTQALDLAKGADRSELLVGRARAHRIIGKFDDALRDLDRARLHSTPGLRLQIHKQVVLLHAIRGDLDLAEQLLDAEPVGSTSPEKSQQVAEQRAELEYGRGNILNAVRMTEAVVRGEVSEALGHLQGNLMWFYFVLGRWDASLDMSCELMKRAEKEGDLWNLTLPLIVAARINVERGQIPYGIDFARKGLRVSERLGCPADIFDCLGAMTAVLLVAGRPQEASKLAHRMLPLFEEGIEWRPDQAAVFVVGGEALLDAGDSVAARMFAEKAGELSGESVWGIAVDRLKAQIFLKLRDWRRSVEFVEKWPPRSSLVPFEQARLHEIAARSYFMACKREDGEFHARRAKAIFSDLGVNPRAKRVETLLARHLPRKPGRPRSDLPGGLTPREAEVLQLVLQGLSNRQISEVLTVSALTVKKHVENLRAKASVHKRVDLLEFAARMGLAADGQLRFR